MTVNLRSKSLTTATKKFPMAEKQSFEHFKELLDKLNSRDAENILVYENKVEHNYMEQFHIFLIINLYMFK
jgi:hypothetical protein